MNASTRFVAALTVASLALGGLVLALGLGVSPASAAESALPAPPPSGSSVGVSIDQFPSGPDFGIRTDISALCSTSGGVTTPPVTGQALSAVATPVVYSMCDPWTISDSPGYLLFPFQAFANPDNRPGAVMDFSAYGNIQGQSEAIVCQRSQYDTSTYTLDSSGGLWTSGTTGFTAGGVNADTIHLGAGVAVDLHSCPFLVSANIQMARDVNGVWKLQLFTWSADVAVKSPIKYSGDAYDVSKIACTLGGSVSSQICSSILHDSTHQCDNAPVEDWSKVDSLDFNGVMSWFGEHMDSYLGHATPFYAFCLFMPAFGFDSHGVINTAFLASPLNQLQQPFTMTATAWQFSPACGNVAGPAPASSHWAAFTLNTCDLPAAVTGPLITIARVGIWALSGWFMLRFVMRVLVSIVRYVSPMEEEAK